MKRSAAAFCGTCAVVIGLAGCASDAPSRPSGAAGAPRQQVAEMPPTHPVLAADAMPAGRSDSELWAQSCSRCHYARDPTYYKPGQWALVMQQMRVRGYLTGEEARRITAYLKDASK